MTRRALAVVVAFVVVLAVAAAACGGGTEHTLTAQKIPHRVPIITAPAPTTTTTPPTTEPPTTAAAITTVPPTTALVPAQDCYSLVVEIADTIHRDLGRFPTRQEILDVLNQDSRGDCYPLVDSVHTLPQGPFGG
jgi:hypothetical protein